MAPSHEAMRERIERIMRARDSADYIQRVVIRQVRQFDEMFSGTVFPPFADPDAQAERVAQDYWNERMSEPVGEDDDVDAGVIADQAHERSLAFYSTLAAMHTTVLNLFTAGLYHLFEQQCGSLLRDWTGASGSVQALRDWLRTELRIDTTGCPSWPRMNELRLVANVVKHAEGDSERELRQLNPIYFREPLIRQPEFADIPSPVFPLGAPLTGELIFITKANYDEFVQTVISFWEWLASELERR